MKHVRIATAKVVRTTHQLWVSDKGLARDLVKAAGQIPPAARLIDINEIDGETVLVFEEEVEIASFDEHP